MTLSVFISSKRSNKSSIIFKPSRKIAHVGRAVASIAAVFKTSEPIQFIKLIDTDDDMQPEKKKREHRKIVYLFFLLCEKWTSRRQSSVKVDFGAQSGDSFKWPRPGILPAWKTMTFLFFIQFKLIPFYDIILWDLNWYRHCTCSRLFFFFNFFSASHAFLSFSVHCVRHNKLIPSSISFGSLSCSPFSNAGIIIITRNKKKPWQTAREREKSLFLLKFPKDQTKRYI